MAQFARPSSDIATGNWTTAPLYSKINETSYNDSTEIVLNNSTSSTCQLGLSSVTDPGVSTGHIVRIRSHKTGTGTITLTGYLYESTTLRATITITLGTGYATTTYTLTAGEADSITNYANLRLYLTGVANASGRYVYVSWAEFEVPNAPVKASQASYLKGGVVDSHAAYLVGGITSSHGAYLKGGVSSSKAAYMRGGISSNQVAFLVGGLVDTHSGYLYGQVAILGNVPSYLTGQDTTLGSTGAYANGSAAAAPASGAQAAWLGGKSAYALRPDGDIAQGGFQNELGGATLYTSLNEAMPDLINYVWHEAPAVGSYFEVSLTNPSGIVPANNHVLRWYGRRIGGTLTTTVNCELRQGASTVIVSDERTLTDSYQLFEKTLSAGEIASITDYDDLRFRFTVTGLS